METTAQKRTFTLDEVENLIADATEQFVAEITDFFRLDDMEAAAKTRDLTKYEKRTLEMAESILSGAAHLDTVINAKLHPEKYNQEWADARAKRIAEGRDRVKKTTEWADKLDAMLTNSGKESEQVA